MLFQFDLVHSSYNFSQHSTVETNLMEDLPHIPRLATDNLNGRNSFFSIRIRGENPQLKAENLYKFLIK